MTNIWKILFEIYKLEIKLYFKVLFKALIINQKLASQRTKQLRDWIRNFETYKETDKNLCLRKAKTFTSSRNFNPLKRIPTKRTRKQIDNSPLTINSVSKSPIPKEWGIYNPKLVKLPFHLRLIHANSSANICSNIFSILFLNGWNFVNVKLREKWRKDGEKGKFNEALGNYALSSLVTKFVLIIVRFDSLLENTSISRLKTWSYIGRNESHAIQ